MEISESINYFELISDDILLEIFEIIKIPGALKLRATNRQFNRVFEKLGNKILSKTDMTWKSIQTLNYKCFPGILLCLPDSWIRDCNLNTLEGIFKSKDYGIIRMMCEKFLMCHQDTPNSNISYSDYTIKIIIQNSRDCWYSFKYDRSIVSAFNVFPEIALNVCVVYQNAGLFWDTLRETGFLESEEGLLRAYMGFRDPDQKLEFLENLETYYRKYFTGTPELLSGYLEFINYQKRKIELNSGKI